MKHLLLDHTERDWVSNKGVGAAELEACGPHSELHLQEPNDTKEGAGKTMTSAAPKWKNPGKFRGQQTHSPILSEPGLA